MATRVTQKPAFDAPWIEFGPTSHLDPMDSRDLSPAFGTESTKIRHILPFPSKGLERDLSRVSTRWNKVLGVDRVCSSLCPIGMAKTRVTKQGSHVISCRSYRTFC